MIFISWPGRSELLILWSRDINPAIVSFKAVSMRPEMIELLKKLEVAIQMNEQESQRPSFKIDASATDIIELVLAFHAKGLFQVEGQQATQKWVIEWAESAFGIPLKNWEQVAVNIRNRKSSGSKFLGELTKSLNDRFNRILLDKQYQRRLRNK